VSAASTILAVDLGGTRLRAARAEAGGRLTPLEMGPAPQSLAEFQARIGGLIEQAGAERLGIGVPGLARGTTCIWIPNLGFLDGADLAALFPGIAIGLGNDAQLALLAEATDGAAQGRSDALLLSIGTGIGSAVLSGGRIVKGSRGGACSFGWATADLADAGNPRQGWLERQASGRALDVVARELGLADGVALIEAGRAGNAAARRALERPMQALGSSLAGAVGLLDPEVIIVTGGVAAALDLLAPLVLAALRRQLPPHLRSIDIKAGQFGPQAGLRGAALAGWAGPDWGSVNG
jgi:glucokinase